MHGTQLGDIARKLARLADLPETSSALRAYLNSAADRDIVDVMNEVELLARIMCFKGVVPTSR